MYDILIVGGGAAGFFAAMSAKSASPEARVAILEKSAVPLSKVRVSGGGRCNVTHACFDQNLLSKNYPRGTHELKGPFHRFQPQDTIEWFEKRGVSLHTESDGRMFPTTNNSDTIIQCFYAETKRLGIEIHLKQKIVSIERQEEMFHIKTKEGKIFPAFKLILATGSSEEGLQIAASLGHQIKLPVPSLFTFNVPNFSLSELSGISIPALVKIKDLTFYQQGPCLITHFGFSGPSVLKLSAWAARELHTKNYQFDLLINWLPALTLPEIIACLEETKRTSPAKGCSSVNPFQFPKNFWRVIVNKLGLVEKRWNDLSTKDFHLCASTLHEDSYFVSGKTTHKEEFVTCGGIDLSQVNFKTMESKTCQNLFFAGEVLDIDGITGGFNFQNAWTTGYIAGSSAAS